MLAVSYVSHVLREGCLPADGAETTVGGHWNVFHSICINLPYWRRKDAVYFLRKQKRPSAVGQPFFYNLNSLVRFTPWDIAH